MKKRQRIEAQKGFFEKREALSVRISDLDKELLRLQNQSDKLAERQDAQVEYMWNEYGLDILDGGSSCGTDPSTMWRI